MHRIGRLKGKKSTFFTVSEGRWLIVGVLCTLVGYWAPWITHRSVGLVQNGFDLSEFVKFLPQVKDGSESLVRWFFFLPLATTAFSICLLASWLSGASRKWLRLPFMAISLVLLVILIPPYPYSPDRVLGNEFRARTILACITWIACSLIPIWQKPFAYYRWGCPLLVSLSVTGAIGPTLQMWSLHDAVSSAYGSPTVVGWGVWLMVTGMLAVLGSTLSTSRRWRSRTVS